MTNSGILIEVSLIDLTFGIIFEVYKLNPDPSSKILCKWIWVVNTHYRVEGSIVPTVNFILLLKPKTCRKCFGIFRKRAMYKKCVRLIWPKAKSWPLKWCFSAVWCFIGAPYLNKVHYYLEEAVDPVRGVLLAIKVMFTHVSKSCGQSKFKKRSYKFPDAPF